jgi:sialate O-acetylesterase
VIKLAQIFGNGMVLQRQKPIQIWGTAAAGSQITAKLGATVTASASIQSDGKWHLTLPSQEAARQLTLEITDGHDKLEFTDIAIGEVWVAGGQSNMEFQLEFDKDREHVINGPMNPDIKFFDVPMVSYEGQESEYNYSQFGWWRSCTPEDLRYFSAVGYYFASDLQQTLDVPIGVVGCNWGGTPACAWADKEILTKGPGAVWIDDYQAGLAQFDVDEEASLFRAHRMNDRTDPFADPLLYRLMRHGFSQQEEVELLPTLAQNVLPTMGALHPNRPGGLFETMVRRLAPYPVRGAIWYQGESDAPRAEVHREVLRAVIASWRNAWDDEDFVFLITQLAPYGESAFGNGDRFPEVRQQQALAAASIPSTWMASTSDAGSERDIHPKAKHPVGSRLALLARGHVYGEDVLCDAPELLSAQRTDDGVELLMDNAEGLHWDGNTLPLEIVTPTGESIVPTDVSLQDKSVIVKGDIPTGSCVSFAWSGYYQVGLRNAAGLPAVPFREVV